MDFQFIIGQLFNGLVLGSFYVLLALGLTIIFGMMGVVNFAHGAIYMLGAYSVYTLVTNCSLNFWLAVLIAPLIVGAIGIVIERTLLRRTYSIPPFFNLLLTFGIMIILQESVRIIYSASAKPFSTPLELSGGVDLGVIFFPKYRLFILVMATILALGTWLFLEKTKLGAIIRAGTDDSRMVDALGIDISKIFTLVFGIGTGLAGMAGALAAPIQNIFPYMGTNVVSDTMVIVIIGGMGSIFGSILGGILIGELITVGVLIWPPMASALIYVFMAVILLVRPRGFFGREKFFE
ncbi:MAG: branched-chain amino acid ABC transporter permease [Syntrophorhabdales bacterium]|jgi:branched-chain amino acid transport system permease protein